MFKLLFFQGLLLISISVFAQNKQILGELDFSDLLLQPQFNLVEADRAEFELQRSYFFFSWNIHKNLSAQFGLGQFELVNPNQQLASNNALTGEYDQLRFFEAFAKWDSGLGIVRAGMIPLFLGWEGSRRESEWVLPRTLFYENHNFGFRDQGVSYEISYNKFFTQFAIHNGENGKDVDGELWHSMRFGWSNSQNLEIVFSSTNGNYQQTKTDPMTEFNYLNGYSQFKLGKLSMLLEGYYLKEEPEVGAKSRLWNYHLDLVQSLNSSWDALFRYEYFEPNNNLENDAVTRWIVGFSFFNELRTSQFFIWGVIDKEENMDLNNNQIQLVWKIRSLSIF